MVPDGHHHLLGEERAHFSRPTYGSDRAATCAAKPTQLTRQACQRLGALGGPQCAPPPARAPPRPPAPRLRIWWDEPVERALERAFRRSRRRPSASSTTRLSSRAQRARSGDHQIRATCEPPSTSPVPQPSAGVGLDALAQARTSRRSRSRTRMRSSRKVRDVSSRSRSKQDDVPALAAVGKLVRLDAAGRRTCPRSPCSSRSPRPGGGRCPRSGRAPCSSSPFARDLKIVLGGVRPRASMIFSRAELERALGDVLADQVDRGDERLRLQRQQTGRARSRRGRAPDDLDRVALDIGV